MTTRIVDDRETGLRIGYDATDWTQAIPFDAYHQAMKEWIIQTIVRDETPIGAVFRKDDELHVSVLPDWRRIWATKGLLRQLFGTGKVTTKVTPGHEHMYGILARLGFEQHPDGMLVKGH